MPKIFYSESQLDGTKAKAVCDTMLEGLLCRVCANACIFMEQNEHWEVHCSVRNKAVACHPDNKHVKVLICSEFDNVDGGNAIPTAPVDGSSIITPN